MAGDENHGKQSLEEKAMVCVWDGYHSSARLLHRIKTGSMKKEDKSRCLETESIGQMSCWEWEEKLKDSSKFPSLRRPKRVVER